VERVAAGAGTARVGVVDREALLLDRVDEVDGRAAPVRAPHPLHHHLHHLPIIIAWMQVPVDLDLLR